MLADMAAELVQIPATIVSTGPEATELIAAFRVSDRMSGIAVGVDETDDEVIVRVEAAWNGLEASAGAIPFFTFTSTLVELERRVGDRRVRAVPDRRHPPGIC
jgi:hypothetical protein